jgi:hypothetical protein
LDFIPLQSKFFPAKFFFGILEKENFGGKKFTLPWSFFPIFWTSLTMWNTLFMPRTPEKGSNIIAQRENYEF